MINVLYTVGCYLLFNLGVYYSTLGGSDLALGVGYILGCVLIRWRLANQIRQQSQLPINWWCVIGNAVSILVTANALRYAHARVPLSLSMEAVYNGLAMLSWPTFLLLGNFWPKHFSDKPKAFDLLCHGLMFLLVATRFNTYGAYSIDAATWAALACAAIGYIGVNVTIKLFKGHRLSSIYGILLAAVILLAGQFYSGAWQLWSLNGYFVISLVLVSIASYGIPVYLAGAYAHFKSLSSLVPPLVYDTLLVTSPLVMIVRHEVISPWTIGVGIGMIIVTVIRFRYHTGKQWLELIV